MASWVHDLVKEPLITPNSNTPLPNFTNLTPPHPPNLSSSNPTPPTPAHPTPAHPIPPPCHHQLTLPHPTTLHPNLPLPTPPQLTPSHPAPAQSTPIYLPTLTPTKLTPFSPQICPNSQWISNVLMNSTEQYLMLCLPLLTLGQFIFDVLQHCIMVFL